MARDRTRYRGHKIIPGLSYSTVITRVNQYNWDVAKACTTPANVKPTTEQTKNHPWKKYPYKYMQAKK